jgi:WD40 repeat protein
MMSKGVLVAALVAFAVGCASAGGEGTIGGAQVTVRELLTLDAFDAHVAFSPDGRILATGLRGNAATPGQLKFWDVATGANRVTTVGHSSGIIAVAFSPDGRTVATGGLDNTVRVWDVAAGRLRDTFTGYGIEPVFSPDGGTLATSVTIQGAPPTNWIRLWDMGTLQGRTDLRHVDVTNIYALAFSPDGKSLFTGSSRTITIWDLATGEQQSFYRGPSGGARALAFSPDGKTLATGYSAIPRLWDVASGDRLHRLPQQRNQIFALTFSPDGEILVTGAGNTSRGRGTTNALTLWDVETGTMITIIDTDGRGVTSVAFSPDGTQLAVGLFEADAKIFGITRENVR